MSENTPSSAFTNSEEADAPFGPPMIGALLRSPWEAVQRRMLERLHDQGFADLDFAHLSVFQYPGPQGARPSELAARLGITKQALNYLLGELERLDYLQRRPDPDDLRSKRVALTRRRALQAGRAAPPRPPRDPHHPRGGRRSRSGLGTAARAGAVRPVPRRPP